MSQSSSSFSIEDNDRRESDVRPIQYKGVPDKPRGLCIDEALSKTQFGLFNYIVILLSGIILISGTNDTVDILCYILPVAECDLGLTTSKKGILAGAPFVGMILSSHLFGFLADTRGRRSVIQPTLLVAFIISVTSSFVQNFYIFTVLRFLNGFFMSGCSATIFAYLSEFHGKAHRARAIMGASVIFSACMALMPLLAWIVINQNWKFYIPFIDIVYKPWRLYVVVGGLFEFIAFMIISFLPETPKFVLSQGKQNEAYQILEKINRINNGKGSPLERFELYEEPESIESRQQFIESKSSRFPFLKSVWIQTAPVFKSYLCPTVLLCFMQFSIYSVTHGFAMFLPEILNRMARNTNNYFYDRGMMCDVIHMKPKINETNNFAGQKVCVDKLELEMLEQSFTGEIAYIVGSVFIAFIIDKFVAKFPILFIILIGTGVGGLSCILNNIPILQIGSFLIHIVLCGLAGNILNAAACEIYPTNLRGMAVSLNLMFARAGGVVGSNVSSFLLENHCQMLFGLSSSLLLASAVLSYFIPKVHQKIGDSNKIANEPRASVFSSKFN